MISVAVNLFSFCCINSVMLVRSHIPSWTYSTLMTSNDTEQSVGELVLPTRRLPSLAQRTDVDGTNGSTADVTITLSAFNDVVTTKTRATRHHDPDPSKPEDEGLFTSAHMRVFSEDLNVTAETEDVFSTINKSGNIELNVTFVSPTKGCIQSPDRGSVETLAAAKLDSTARVTVPERYWLLVSWWIRLKDRCPLVNLELYIGDANYQRSRHRWAYCDEEPPVPELFHTGAFYVRLFVTSPAENRGRFRLLFTFHADSSLPLKLPGDKWNCSVSFWRDFQQHLGCNLKSECAGDEDEAACDYASRYCGPGLISAAGGCYKYIAVGRPGTWQQARAACRELGGYLVSLNTPEEWDAVLGLLRRVSVVRVYTGLVFKNPFLHLLYVSVPTWLDETMMYYGSAIRSRSNKDLCSSFDFSRRENYLLATPCDRPLFADIMCEMKNKSSPGIAEAGVVLPGRYKRKNVPLPPMIRCPAGHRVIVALACDTHSACWGRGFGSAYVCDAPLNTTFPSFACSNRFEHVSYSMLCNFRKDCKDGSDEDFCVHPPCTVDPFPCGNKQCVNYRAKCDFVQNCVNDADELMCFRRPVLTYERYRLPYPITGYNTRGMMKRVSWERCIRSMFKCRTIPICMPLYARCNGINDCPGREDELGCDTCLGFFRCRGSSICLQAKALCDRIPHCPQHDDELFCQLSCPAQCTCHALSAYCYRRFSVREIADLRFLEARGSGMTLADLVNKTFLVRLGLSGCGLRQLGDTGLPNVQYLDVSDNKLTVVSFQVLVQFSNLRELFLDDNPLSSVFIRNEINDNRSLASITSLRLSRTFSREMDVGTLTIFPNLTALNFSGSAVERISGQGLSFLSELTTLDMRQNPLTIIPPNFIRDLHKLETVFADNYKLCCPAMLPERFNQAHCHAPSDEISSCYSLLGSSAYRVMLSLFAALALIGNLGSFTYRVLINVSRGGLGFGVFVTHLSVSDLLMGIYLAAIGVADRVYLGSYLWVDTAWKNSAVCSMAGFLSLLSSQVSAFIICLITLDRFLVLRFPFRQLHFNRRSAHVTSGVAWTVGIVLAATPLLPVTSYWKFYSQNGICLPLPITQKHFPGHSYSFGVFIVLNFFLILLIAVGQLSIYYTVTTTSSMDVDTTKSSKDMAIARRLITIAMTDFLCWFPIGLLGLLASNGTPISGEVNVAMAVLALPLNSALNPFLYTFNMIMERRRKENETRLHKIIMATQQA